MQAFTDVEQLRAGTERTEGARYHQSMFVGLLYRGETAQLRNPVDITGQYPEHIDKFGADRGNFVHGQHYSSANLMSAMFDFDTYLKGHVGDDELDQPFLSEQMRQNTICFQGAQMLYHPEKKDWCIEVKNTGHLGPTYAGVRPVREGQQKAMQPPYGRIGEGMKLSY